MLGLARRMTAYKRPELLFEDLERLRGIARNHPFRIVLAGKLARTLLRLFHTSDRSGWTRVNEGCNQQECALL